MLTPDFLFSLANPAAMLGWALLVLAPRWRGTQRLVLNGAWSLILAGAYAALIATHYLGGHGSEGGFGSLAQVAALFHDPWALLAGWVHYLCFDLFTGAWEVRDAQRRGLPHWAMVPALVLTFLFGPVGLLVYFGTRQVFGKPVATPDSV
ncbi:MAG: ABA4-like family protein [Janthinobacterium lividum]